MMGKEKLRHGMILRLKIIVAGEKEDVLPCLSIHVDLDEYSAFWKPWWQALILKVLSRSISFRVLEQ